MEKEVICFVCGKSFPERDVAIKHIFDNHREGIDYVKCPLGHCGIPVRDVIAHIKAKHPQIDPRKVPGQHKALICNYHMKSGKKKRKPPKIKTGNFYSNKMNRMIAYRSGLECSVYEVLDVSPDVISFVEESLKIEYIYKGGKRRYIPDLLISFTDGTKEIWEVKPKNQKGLEINQCKWAAANLHCHAMGWRFVVIDQDAIKILKHRLANNIPLRG